MNINRKQISKFSLLLLLYFLIGYYISGAFYALQNGMRGFIEDYLTASGFPYYGIRAFIFIVIPIFLAFIAIVGDLDIQHIVRLKQLNKIQRARILILFRLTSAFMLVHFIVGFMPPFAILGDVIFHEFALLFCLQEGLYFLCLILLGLIWQAIRILIQNNILSAFILFVSLILYYMMNGIVHFIILDLDYITPYYLGDDTANILIILSRFISAIIITTIIQYMISSKEEFYVRTSHSV